MSIRRRDNPPEEELRRFLLGQLSEREEQHYHERLLADDQLFREVDALADRVQDELAEEYLSGNLTGEARRTFERSLLPCSAIREKLQLHDALRTRAVCHRRQRSWPERLALWVQPLLRPVPALAGALLVVLVAGGSWSISRMGRLQRELEAAAAARPAPMRAGGATVDIASVVLRPGLQRSESAIPTVAVASGQRIVELRLDIGLDEYPSYQVELFGSSGEKVLEQNLLQATPERDTAYVILELSTRNLRADDYQARLGGITAGRQVRTIDRYYFRLITR